MKKFLRGGLQVLWFASFALTIWMNRAVFSPSERPAPLGASFAINPVTMVQQFSSVLSSVDAAARELSRPPGDEIVVAPAERVRDTQSILRDPAARAAALRENPEAAKFDAIVRDAAGSAANEQKIYELAADVLGDLSHDTGADPEAMRRTSFDGLKDPKAFVERLSPEQRRRFDEIKAQIQNSARTLP